MISFKQLYVYLLIPVLTGCAGLAEYMKKNATVNNWMPIHSDPKVGDYAVYTANRYLKAPGSSIYKSSGHNLKHRKEVVEIKDNLIHFTSTQLHNNHLINHYIVDMKGNVIKAWLENKESKKTFPLKIAAKSSKKYIRKKLNIKTSLSQKNKKYEINGHVIDDLYIKTNNSSIPLLGDSDIRHTIFYSNNVPFGDVSKEIESIKFNKGLYLKALDAYIDVSLPANTKDILDSINNGGRNNSSKVKRKFVIEMTDWNRNLKSY